MHTSPRSSTRSRNTFVEHWGRLVAATALASATACAGAGPNVRALRMAQQQEPTPALLQEHIRQMADALETIDELLHRTPYSPGAAWIRELPFDEARAESARAAAPTPACRASFVCLYTLHIRRVMQQARVVTAVPPTPTRSDRAPMEVANVAPPQGILASAERALAKPGSPGAPTERERAVLVQDTLTVSSVAWRLAIEAGALATVVSVEAMELGQGGHRTVFSGAPEATELAATLPAEARRLYQALEANANSLRTVVTRLSQLDGSAPTDSPGFEFEDGLVDEIVGFGWDSVHVDVQAGGDALFYTALADQEFSTESDGTTFDYTGRQTRLEYDVEPIVLAQAKLSMSLDWPRLADIARLDLGFATNRVYKSGGEFQEGSLASELGATDELSEALDAGLAIANVTASVRIARFTHGTVRDVLIADGSLLAEAPFTFDMKRIDLGYDLAPQGDPLLERFTVGFRYFDYSLPRILYELVNSTPGVEPAAFVFSRETPPQAIRTRLYMLSVTGRFEKRLNSHLTPFLNLDLAAGYGPTQYFFLLDPNGGDIASNREAASSSGLGVGFAGALGVRWHLGGPEAILRAYVDAYYQGQFLRNTLDTRDDGDTIVNVGTTDAFHGPTAALGATF